MRSASKIVSVRDDLVDDVAGQERQRRAHAVLLRHCLRLLQRLLVFLGDFAWQSLGHSEARHGNDVERSNDVDERYCGALLGCQLDSELDGLVGGRRAIYCYQDPFHRSFLSGLDLSST